MGCDLAGIRNYQTMTFDATFDATIVIRYDRGTKYASELFFATVAQLVEQGPLKPKVLGSIPSRRIAR